MTSTITISRQSLRPDPSASATITDVKPVASYSWVEASNPTIAVPGVPPQWSPPATSRQLPKDSGMIYIAQNAARHPTSPMEPLFRALEIEDPTFDLRSVDVVSDRNNIRKLLSFIDPDSSRNGLEPFTINVEVVGNTMILNRTETKTYEIIGPQEFRGFGHEFEKAYTKCEIGDSTGHHRIVSYRFGGLKFLVRHEVDGYVEGLAGSASSSRSKGQEADSLSSLLGSLSLSGPANTTNSKSPPKTSKPAGSKLTIRKEGHAVPLQSTLEIKTRVAHKPLVFSEITTQLWASQTPKLVRAYHRRGVFEKPQVEDVMPQIRAWERDHQTHLRELALLLKKMVAAVWEQGGGAVLKYDVVTDRLSITKAKGGRLLPADLYKKWEMRDGDGVPGVGR